MNDFHEHLVARKGQFEHFLSLMHERRAVCQRNCYVIFHELPDHKNDDDHRLFARRARSLSLAGCGKISAMRGSTEADGGDAGSAEVGDEPGRFVQFCLSDRDFWMDLPNTTLDAAEGNLLVRRRSGFFWVHDHRDSGNWQKTIRDFDPVNKIYLPGDVRCAAEDVAYIFFTLWKFPVDWRLYVTSFALKGPKFESDRPL